MRCEHCQGCGMRDELGRPWYAHSRIFGEVWCMCSECGGRGVVSCCEGSERHGQIGPGDDRD